MRIKRHFRTALASAACLVAASGMASAATDLVKATAIDNGLAYLASTQQGDGSWGGYGTFDAGAALLAFEEKGYAAGTDVVINGTHYGDVVGKALGYLMNQAVAPNGGAPGIAWYNTGAEPSTYYLGAVGPALAKANLATPVNSLPGFGGNPLTAGETIGQVLQGLADQAAYGQGPTGGWTYGTDHPITHADNSNSQWPTLALVYAQSVGINPSGSAPVPTAAAVKTALNSWIVGVQNPDGGSGYDNPYGNCCNLNYSNMSRTGALLLESKYVGLSINDPVVQKALAWINNNWAAYAGGWDGNFGLPYGMWAAYKGLEAYIGSSDTTYITNLLDLGGGQGACGSLDGTQTCNWWENYNQYLVNAQAGGGQWNQVCYSECINTVEYTSWALGILQATVIPNDVPEPASLALLGIGIVGLGAIRRRLRN